MRTTPWAVALFLVLSEAVSAQATFWLRNTEPDAVFYYWTVPSAPLNAQVLPLLALAPGGRHGVSTGERARVSLGVGQTMVAAFVPWNASPGYLTPVSGGFLVPSEAPTKGPVQINRASFAAFNRGRALEAPLQAWGLNPPRHSLGGRPDPWSGVPASLEWGAVFQPGGKPWPKAWPQLKSLQVDNSEGALWLRLLTDRAWPVPANGVSISLILKRPGAFFQWPLTGQDGTVWSWVEGNEPLPAGSRVVRGATIEAWVPWDRLPPAETKVWETTPAVWSVLVSEGDSVTILDLGGFSLDELP